MFSGRRSRPNVQVFHFICSKPQITHWKCRLSQYRKIRKTFTSWCCLPKKISLNSVAAKPSRLLSITVSCLFLRQPLGPIFFSFIGFALYWLHLFCFQVHQSLGPIFIEGGVLSRRQIVVRWNNSIARVKTLRKKWKISIRNSCYFVFCILSYLHASVLAFLCVEVGLYFNKHGRNKRISHELNMLVFKPSLIGRWVILIPLSFES